MRKKTTTNKFRPISEIALEIKKDWGKVSPYAAPYLTAMYCLTNVTDRYQLDDGKTIIAYFLSNAGTWKGETAKRIKAELKSMIKERKERNLSKDFEKVYQNIIDCDDAVRSFVNANFGLAKTADAQAFNKLADMAAQLHSYAHELEERLAWD